MAMLEPTETERRRPSSLSLEPVTQRFIEGMAASGAPPLYTLTPQAARNVLVEAQRAPVFTPPASIEDMIFPVGPTGTTGIRIIRPQGVQERLPVLMWFHGGGWVLGDRQTHDQGTLHARGLGSASQHCHRLPDSDAKPAHRQRSPTSSLRSRPGCA